MRNVNGTYARNRLPAETTSTAAEVGKSIGGAALQALLVVATVRAADALFTAVMERRRARNERPAT